VLNVISSQSQVISGFIVTGEELLADHVKQFFKGVFASVYKEDLHILFTVFVAKMDYFELHNLTRSLGDLNYVFAGLLTLHNILSYLFTDFIFRDVEVLFRALFDYSVHKHVGVPGGSLAHAASS